MKTRGKTTVPRNPFALAARQRNAGAHDKRHKVRRRDDRQALRQAMQALKEKDGDTVLLHLCHKPSACSLAF